ncbi:hypothetical protein PR001_g10555 [Phytophthora rubi]|nr:hypothetical protein PR001_g10555 [Phytophthora rubi]
MAKLMATTSYRLDIKLTGGDYDEWSERLMTVFIAMGVNEILLGRKHLDERRGDKWVNCSVVRRKKAHNHMVKHVEWSVLQGFRRELRTGNPWVLWDALRERYGEGNGLNPVYLERQLLTRCLDPSERVRKYIDDMMDNPLCAFRERRAHDGRDFCKHLVVERERRVPRDRAQA